VKSQDITGITNTHDLQQTDKYYTVHKETTPTDNVNDKSQSKLNWHPAFFQAMQQELFDWKDLLEFKYEYQLTSEPLRIDLLIIKKPKDIFIEKNIARIFRADNIFEYKSPEDYVSVKDFLKVYAYANLYAAITPDVELSGITLTFVESRYPRKLIKYLKTVRGYGITEASPGIYQVEGDYIPIQIIESKKLSASENIWLNSLTNNLEIGNAGVIMNEKREKIRELSAYLEVILQANSKVFLEVYKMSNAMTFEEVFTEAGIIPEWIERGRKEGIKLGMEKGMEKGREQGMEKGREQTVRNLYSMGMSAEKIAQATELPLERVRALAN